MATRKRTRVPGITPSQPPPKGGSFDRVVLGGSAYNERGNVRQRGHHAEAPGVNAPGYAHPLLQKPGAPPISPADRAHAIDRTEPPRGEDLYSPTQEATGDWYLRYAYKLAREGDSRLLLPYQPTPTSHPLGNEAFRPDGYKYARTLAAGYDPKTQQLRVRFRKGEGWIYYQVPPAVWANFRRAPSPGKFINRVLNHYPYGPGDF